MRYDDPTMLEALAREYVLGTLHGPARARFARVLSASLVARRAVASWERRLAPLASALPPVAPPAHAWTQIESTLGLRKRTHDASLALWRGLAAGFAVAALLLAGLYVSQRQNVERPDYVAVVADAATGPVWLMQGFTRTSVLRVSTVNDRPVPAGNSYELWMLPSANAPAGAAPVSLGLIAGVGDTLLNLTAAQLALLGQTMTLAVSLEQAGGSTTGLPMGPVIFTAPLVRG